MNANETKTTPPPNARRRRRKRVTWLVVLATVALAAWMVIPQVGIWQARVSLDERKHDSARWWLSVSGNMWKKGAEWHFLSAIYQRRTGHLTKAVEQLKQAQQSGWPVADLEREQHLIDAQSGRFGIVAPHWSELFRTAGADGPEICSAYVRHMLMQLKFSEAQSVLRSWKKDFPDDPEPWFMEGRITSTLKRWDEAEKQFRQALKLSRGHAAAAVELAKVLNTRLRFQDAEQLLRNADPPAGLQAEANALLARSMAGQGRTDEAMALVTQSMESAPENIDLLAEYGRLLLARDSPEKAIEVLAKILKARPADTVVRYSFAQALKITGKNDEAAAQFALVDAGTKATARLGKLTDRLMQTPDDLETRFRVAEITWKWQSRQQGVAWFLSVLERAPNHQPTHRILVEHYESIGDSAKAEFHRSRLNASESGE